jgi:hypothetical protein
MADAVETVAERYDREYLRLKDDRKVRGFDYKSEERRSREFVDPNTITVDEDGTVHGTVTARHDNEPEGFDRTAFEESLVYDPNA